MVEDGALGLPDARFTQSAWIQDGLDCDIYIYTYDRICMYVCVYIFESLNSSSFVCLRSVLRSGTCGQRFLCEDRCGNGGLAMGRHV